MSVKLLIEHHLMFLSLKGGCRGSSESTLVKIPHCWKLHALAHNMNKGNQRDDHQAKTETKNYITKPEPITVMVATLVFGTRVASITTPRPPGP